MNWLHFFLWVAGAYCLYYLVMILIDLTGKRTDPAGRSLTNELTFAESVQTKQIQHPAAAENAEDKKGSIAENRESHKRTPEVIASGGVSLKDLFNLARQEAIIYTHSVGF